MFPNPSRIIELIDIRPGMKVADFGCGSGHLTIEMAKRVGGDGVVYAFDVQKEALEALKSRALSENLSNLEYRRVDLEAEKGTHLTDGLMDVVLISNVLFQSEDKNAMAKESFRILKPEGRTAVVEWKPAGKLGPPEKMRVEKDDMRKIFTQSGFTENREFEAGESHYGIIFMKQ